MKIILHEFPQFLRANKHLFNIIEVGLNHKLFSFRNYFVPTRNKIQLTNMAMFVESVAGHM